jgi:hypothetical protein
MNTFQGSIYRALQRNPVKTAYAVTHGRAVLQPPSNVSAGLRCALEGSTPSTSPAS